MEITEVRIKIMEEPGERLQGFCSITFDDCFVVRDLKIIEGGSGPFVAMPSRKLTAHCPQCGCKNHLRAAYCNQCGVRLKDDRALKDDDGRAKLYADIAHPINSACREAIQECVIAAYREEVVRSKQPGYVSTYDDPDEEAGSPRRHYERRDSARQGGRRAPAQAPHIAANAEAARVDSARTDSARVDSARVDSARVDSARVDSARVDSARVDSARAITAKPAEAAPPTVPDKSVPGRPTGEKPAVRIDADPLPAEAETRTPHQPPAHHSTGRPSTSPNRGNFGAGIF